MARFKKRGKSYGSRNQILREIGFSSYHSYLRSDLWQRLRRVVMQRDKHKCRLCGEAASEAHHQSYDKPVLAGLKLDLIVALCRRCHELIEFTPRGNKRSVRRVRKITSGLLPT